MALAGPVGELSRYKKIQGEIALEYLSIQYIFILYSIQTKAYLNMNINAFYFILKICNIYFYIYC